MVYVSRAQSIMFLGQKVIHARMKPFIRNAVLLLGYTSWTKATGMGRCEPPPNAS